MLARVKKDDPRFGLMAGDILEITYCDWDPGEKWTVIRRVSDGFDPQCNIYKSEVEILEEPESHE